MIEGYSYNEEGFRAVFASDGWKIGLLTFSERFSGPTEMERHLETDEVFVLLRGKATLYTDRECRIMDTGRVYNVPRGEWHHIIVSEDALVMVVENENTSKDNTEKHAWFKEGDTIC